jgi:DNA-binding NtrC family response regulator
MATILAIDDSVSVLAWLENGLSSAGHRVITCSDGRQGEKLLREAPVDLIITDIYMPERDGLEVIQHARKSAPAVKVIAMSGARPELDMLPAARVLGAARTLKKPFTLEQLVEAVNEALGLVTCSPSLRTGRQGRVPPPASRRTKRSGVQGRQPGAVDRGNARGIIPSRGSNGQALDRLTPET